MASLTIKGISDELLQRLREVAAENRRSLNGEVIYQLERSVGCVPVDPEAFLARLDARRRAHPPIPPLTDELLERAIDEGRP